MYVDKIRSRTEIELCVDLYGSRSEPSFLPLDYNLSKLNLFDKVRRNKFVRVFRVDDEIKAWIYADLVKLPHASEQYFQQFYYGSSLTGSAAYKAVVSLHREMVLFANTTNATWCTSTGSPYDTENTFARILEKQGWTRRGYLAAIKIKE